MPPNRARRVTHCAILGLGATLALVACGAAPVAPSGAAGVSPAGTSPARTAGVQATPTPQPTEPFAIRESNLLPGRYLQAGFPPGVSFVLPAGWKGYFDDADGAYLGGPQGVEIGINKPPKVVDLKTGATIDSPADLAAWLAGSPAFDTVKSSSVTVGGKPAKLVEATSAGERPLFAYASGNFHTVPGSRYAFYVFPMDGPDLVFMLIGSKTSFEAELAMLKTIVDSVRIGRG
jgi:hypothetical protein